MLQALQTHAGMEYSKTCSAAGTAGTAARLQQDVVNDCGHQRADGHEEAHPAAHCVQATCRALHKGRRRV